jgi:hypothetical protein
MRTLTLVFSPALSTCGTTSRHSPSRITSGATPSGTKDTCMGAVCWWYV